MNSIKRGLAHVQASLILISQHKKLLLFPLLGGVVFLITISFGVFTIYSLYTLPSSYFGSFLKIATGLLFILFTNFWNIYLSSALFVAATSALEGKKVFVGEAFRQIKNYSKPLTQWWLFSSGIFFVLWIIQLGLDKILSLFGNSTSRVLVLIVGNVTSIGWSFASYFAIPVLMTHPDTPLPTLKHSTTLFKRTWGENVVADSSISFFGFIIFMSIGLIVTSINYLLYSFAPEITSSVYPLVFLLAAGPTLPILILILTTASAVFKASLYRYAETGDVVGPFKPEMIQGAFIPKKKSLFRLY